MSNWLDDNVIAAAGNFYLKANHSLYFSSAGNKLLVARNVIYLDATGSDLSSVAYVTEAGQVYLSGTALEQFGLLDNQLFDQILFGLDDDQWLDLVDRLQGKSWWPKGQVNPDNLDLNVLKNILDDQPLEKRIHYVFPSRTALVEALAGVSKLIGHGTSLSLGMSGLGVISG